MSPVSLVKYPIFNSGRHTKVGKYFAVIRELIFTEELRQDLEGKKEGIWAMGEVTENGLRMKCLRWSG